MDEDFIHDLKQLITATLRQELSDVVKKDDLKGFATKDDLENFATKDDLKNLATKDDLKNFATKDDLKNLATKDELAQIRTEMATKVELKSGINSLRQHMDERFDETLAAIADTMSTNNEDTDRRLNNHERRITKLEKRHA